MSRCPSCGVSSHRHMCEFNLELQAKLLKHKKEVEERRAALRTVANDVGDDLAPFPAPWKLRVVSDPGDSLEKVLQEACERRSE